MHSSIYVPVLVACLLNMVLAFPSGLHRAAFKGETNSTESIADHKFFDYIVCVSGYKEDYFQDSTRLSSMLTISLLHLGWRIDWVRLYIYHKSQYPAS